MFIPLRHEHMHGRRWPIITLGLIALNLFAFLGTHWQIQEQGPEAGQVRAHILMLAALHPGLHMSDDVQSFVNKFQAKNPSTWKALQNGNRDIADVWDAHMRIMEEPDQWQAEMDSLCQRFQELQSTSLLARFAFTPGHPRLLTYIT